MPLAIELAATWTRILSLDEIARRLEHGLDLLTTTMRGVPARHRSMVATFDHSWRLLQYGYLPVPWGVRVNVHIGAPIARRADEDRMGLLDRVRDDIQVTLDHWRAAEARTA